MNYPAPQYAVAAPVATTHTTRNIIIIVVVILVISFILIALGIGLGVGLGVGLSRRGDNSHSSSSSSSGGSSSSYSILSPPTVTCIYSNSTTCGCSATQPTFLTPKIYQGYTAVADSWPWIVALSINNNNAFCGGFLVSYQYVLTAAHCVSGVTASTIIAYAGIQKLSLINSGQSRVVSTVTVHPNYDSAAVTNDIAVLTLVSPFIQTNTVGLCCLTFDTSLPSANEHGVIAGWGETSPTSTALSDNLLQGVIEVQSFSLCSSTSTQNIRFCAGYNGTDACFGDSGSPFMTSVNNLWTCTGLVSAGTTCGGNTLYTRVSAYQSFINGIINGK
jgi:secreted trypsin-like serine protease